jgi:GNAT superfamily N-acetyltransferase
MQEAIGHVDFSFSSSLRPWGGDPEEYWIEVTGRIMAVPDEAPDDAEAEPAGMTQMLLVRVAEARDDEVSLFAVFDSYDEALHQIYRALFNQNEEIRSSLGMDPFVHEVLFVRSLEVKSRWQGTSLAAQAIQTAASTLVTMGLVVANADLGLSVNNWLNLGFVKIAGQKGFYVRERTKKNRYGRAAL